MGLNPEQATQLGVLENKAGIMNVLTKLNLVRTPRIQPTTLMSQGVLNLLITGTKLGGQENLDRALDESRKEGKGIRFTLRHRADADTPAFRNALVGAGYGDVANNSVFIGGVNMLRRWYILPLTTCEEVIYIATPEDLDESKALISDPTLSPSERIRAQWVGSMFHEMNNKAKSCVKDAIEEGKNLVIYPEGGRSKDGLLRRAVREISIYFPRDGSAIVVPVVINGTDEINRPGQNLGPERILPRNRRSLEGIIGMPYSSREVWTWPDSRKGKDRNPADWVNANIANTYPLGIREEDYLFYESIIESFQPARNRMSIAA